MKTTKNTLVFFPVGAYTEGRRHFELKSVEEIIRELKEIKEQVFIKVAYIIEGGDSAGFAEELNDLDPDMKKDDPQTAEQLIASLAEDNGMNLEAAEELILNHWCVAVDTDADELKEALNEENDELMIFGDPGTENFDVPVCWPESQNLMELPGFRKNAALINDEKGLDEYGSSAYMVNGAWLKEYECKEIKD